MRNRSEEMERENLLLREALCSMEDEVVVAQICEEEERYRLA